MSLGEADTRAKLIDPAIHKRGWTEEFIRREETAGEILNLGGGKVRRASKSRMDYTLRVSAAPQTQPVAVGIIEAKAEEFPPTYGLEQAKRYAALLNVPFAFSTNGHLFVEYDRHSGITSAPRSLDRMPTPADLQLRYEQALGFSLNSELARPLLARYRAGDASRRYYQDAAIRAVLEKIARGKKRALLSLATGTGKTRIAVFLLKKIADAGQLKRALFVCDRDELRKQGHLALQNIFGTDAAVVSGDDAQKNARILIATYQTLGIADEESDASFLRNNYPENYFSHIVIDECHRSAWGKWSEVLRRNPDAVQIGLTATPRELEVSEKNKEAFADLQISADNIHHFGEPVYEYSLGQGIDDGYLAACEIQKGRVDIDNTGITVDQIIARNPVDARTGQPVSADEIRARYLNTTFEDRILLPDRVQAMSEDLFKYMVENGGPEQKTIIFCVRDRHADDVASALNTLYAKWCTENGRQRLDPYAFKCTASVSGADMISDLKDASRSHFIATTVELLTTGVDVPPVRNIVFFKYVNSPIAFYQMLGRGIRIDEKTNKFLFRVYDYTDATRLFGEKFLSKFAPKKPKDGEVPPPAPPETIIQVEGFDVHITDGGKFVVTQIDGRATPVTVEEYRERIAAKLVEEAPTLDDFRARWIAPSQRSELLSHLPERGRSANIIRELDEMNEYDLYDVLGEIGYGLDPRTRVDRAQAFNYKHENWLSTLPPKTASTLKALAAQFANDGTDALESREIFKIPEVVKAGGLDALNALGKKPPEVLREAKERIFAA